VPLGEVGAWFGAVGAGWRDRTRGILTPVPSYYRDPAAPAPNVPRRIGVIALLEREGAVLVQRRADDGAWDFVGGGLDEHETVLGALHREVHEETGLRIADAELFGMFSDPTRIIEYPDGNICRLLSIVFRARPGPGEPRAGEESLELRFVSRNELAELDLWPAARPIRDVYFAGGAGDVVVE
jgi:8-oxo-dGTP pyrophosphatase MutT (NUDIX family)